MYDSAEEIYDANFFNALIEIYGLDDEENFQSYTGSCVDELSIYNLIHVCDRDLSYIFNYSSDHRKIKRDEENEDEENEDKENGKE